LQHFFLANIEWNMLVHIARSSIFKIFKGILFGTPNSNWKPTRTVTKPNLILRNDAPTTISHIHAYLFRKLTQNCKLNDCEPEFLWEHVHCVTFLFASIYSARVNKTRKYRFTFSQSVLTWVSLSCLHSMSCSIHDSKSFAVALSSTILIV